MATFDERRKPMSASGEQITVEIGFSPEVFVAMEMIGLEGEDLAKEMKRATAIDLFKRGFLSTCYPLQPVVE